MDVDRFLTAHQPEWAQLELLLRKAGRGVRRLNAAELDELVRLYQRTATHLSVARTTLRDPALTAQLSALVARAGALVYGTRPRTLRALGRFLVATFPAAVWHSRWFVTVSAALFCLPALAAGVWIAGSPAAREALAPEAVRAAYVEEDFAAYYRSAPAAEFASQVTTNNVRVGFLAFAVGIAFCVLTAFILVLNGANVGLAAGLFASVGQQQRFWGLILPHGLLEITAVFVAGAAGLRLGWALIDPGDRTRRAALTAEGRRAVVIVVGLVLVFLVAGLIEGFVTGSTLPTWARVGIGVVAEAAFVAYVAGCGRAAARQGLTGALGEQDTATWAPAA